MRDGSRMAAVSDNDRSTSWNRASAAARRSRRLNALSGLGLLGRLGLLGLLGLLALLRELLAEALDAAGRVDHALLAGEERVAVGADVGMDFGDGGARLEGVAAGALRG